MAYKSSAGGGNLCNFHLISSDHGTVTSSPALSIDAVVTTNPTGTGVTIVTIKSDNEIKTFINTYASAIAAQAAADEETILLDDSTSVTSASSGSSNQQFLIVSAGGTNADGVLAGAYIGTLTEDTGSHTREAKKFDQHTLGLEGVNALQDVTASLANTLLPSSHWGTGATVTIDTGNWKAEQYVAGA